MNAPEEIATKQWSIEPYASDEIPMYILSGPHRILHNVNLEEEEMQAITALPELFALAYAVVKSASYARLYDMASAALQKATAGQHDTCSHCAGTGRIGDEVCSACNGSGRET